MLAFLVTQRMPKATSFPCPVLTDSADPSKSVAMSPFVDFLHTHLCKAMIIDPLFGTIFLNRTVRMVHMLLTLSLKLSFFSVLMHRIFMVTVTLPYQVVRTCLPLVCLKSAISSPFFFFPPLTESFSPKSDWAPFAANDHVPLNDVTPRKSGSLSSRPKRATCLPSKFNNFINSDIIA